MWDKQCIFTWNKLKQTHGQCMSVHQYTTVIGLTHFSETSDVCKGKRQKLDPVCQNWTWVDPGRNLFQTTVGCTLTYWRSASKLSASGFAAEIPRPFQSQAQAQNCMCITAILPRIDCKFSEQSESHSTLPGSFYDRRMHALQRKNLRCKLHQATNVKWQRRSNDTVVDSFPFKACVDGTLRTVDRAESALDSHELTQSFIRQIASHRQVHWVWRYCIIKWPSRSPGSYSPCASTRDMSDVKVHSGPPGCSDLMESASMFLHLSTFEHLKYRSKPSTQCISST